MINVTAATVGGVLAAAAAAAPRESVTFQNVDSVGLRGDPLNQTRTALFAGSDAGGVYTTRMVRVSGSVFVVSFESDGREVFRPTSTRLPKWCVRGKCPNPTPSQQCHRPKKRTSIGEQINDAAGRSGVVQCRRAPQKYLISR